MADIFTKTSGIRTTLSGTVLRGDVIPSLGKLIPDGRRLILPWGCGDTQRKYPQNASGALYTPDTVATGAMYNPITLEQLVSLIQEGITTVTSSAQKSSTVSEQTSIIQQWQTLIGGINQQITGIQGPQGPAGIDGTGTIVGSVETGTGSGESPGGMVWVRDSSLTWNPSVMTNTLVATFYREGSAMATRTVKVTLNPSTLQLTASDLGSTGETTSYTVSAGTNGSMSVKFVHDDSQCSVAESVFIALAGADGETPILYYIKPTTGTVIKNGTGTVTLEAHKIEGLTDTLLAAGTIQLYAGSTALGYTAVLDAEDIAGSLAIVLKDGTGGTVLDSVMVIDVSDGTDGEPGDDSITGTVECYAGAKTLAWVRARNAGVWSPSTAWTQLKCTFYQAGVVVGCRIVTITLDTGTGLLAVANYHVEGTTFGCSHTVTGAMTSVVTIEFTHTASGIKTAEQVIAVHSGLDGEDGTNGVSPSLYYIRPLNGTAIKNSSGTLTIEGRQVINGVDTNIGTGDIKLYDAAVGGSLVGTGYWATLNATQINGAKTVYLKNGAYGSVLDTITLVDITDGDQVSSDVPVTTNFNPQANSPSLGYVSWTAFTILYKGVTYSIAGTSTALQYVYFDGTTGTVAATNTFADLLIGDRWPLCENSVTAGVSTLYRATMSKYIMGGLVRASTLSSIAANLGTITGGSITLTTTDGNTQWRLDSTGLAGRWKTGSVWGDWKYVAKILGGKTVAAFDAYSTGEAINGLGYMTIVGKTTVANDTGASNTWAAGYRLRLSDTGYTTPYYDSSNSGKLFLSSPITLQQYEQQIYFDENDGNELFICTYNNYSGGTLCGGMDIETFFILPSNEMILIDSIRQKVQNMSAAVDRLTKWESVDTSGAGQIPMTKKIIYPTEYGITVGTTFKVGWRMKWFNPGLSGSQADLTWKGKIKIDTVGVGSQVVKV